MPARVNFRLPNPGATEIRIHGVGGTSPESLLDEPHPDQVAGDGRAGFFRRPGTSTTHTIEATRTIEAYSWGGLTSRKASRALWILLLPFTLANVAGWMVTHREGDSLPAVQERLCRVFALSSTILMIVGIAMITGDLVGVQCGSVAACRDGRWWMGPFGAEVFENFPLRRLLVGLVPALLCLALLVWLSWKNRKEYEDFFPKVGENDAGDDADLPEAGDDANLSSRTFWYRPSLVRDLQFLHVAGVLACLSYLVSAAVHEVHVEPDGGSVPAWVDLLRVASIIALVATAFALFFIRWHQAMPDKKPWPPEAYWGFALFTMLLLTISVIAAWTVHLPLPDEGLQTFRRAPLWIMLLAAAFAVPIAGVQLLSWLKHLEFRARISRGGSRRLLVLSGALLAACGAAAYFRSIEVVYAVLGAALVASPVLRPARVLALMAIAGLLVGAFALWADEPPAVHIVAVFATLSAVLVIYDWSWPRREFRWAGPPIMALFGIVLLGAVISGASTRASDFLDKRQSPDELREAVTKVLERNQTEFQVSDEDLQIATLSVRQAFMSFPVSAESLFTELVDGGIPRPLANRVYFLMSQGDQRPISVMLPNAYSWLTVGLASALLLSVLAFIVLHFAAVVDRRPPDDVRGPGNMDPPAQPLTPKDEKRLKRAVTKMKSFKESAGAVDLLITLLVGLLLLGTIITFLERWAEGLDFWSWVDQPFEAGWDWLLSLSGWIITALPLLAVLAIRKSYSDEASRRKIGIIWDLATFWPRRFHPLAPPSYSERAVPELQQRIVQASEPGKCVVVAAHSQGTVVAFAALLPLSKEKPRRISLATYGCPLGSYYQRLFPSYFRTGDFDALEIWLRGGAVPPHTWRNFWRSTDPIAGCVFSETQIATDERDVTLLDPWWWWRIPGQPAPFLQVHSDYMDDRTLRDWINKGAQECSQTVESAPSVEGTR